MSAIMPAASTVDQQNTQAKTLSTAGFESVNVQSPTEASPTNMSRLVSELEGKVDRLFQHLQEYGLSGLNLEDEHYDFEKTITNLKTEASLLSKTCMTYKKPELETNLKRTDSFGDKAYKSPGKMGPIVDPQKPKTTIQMMKRVKDQLNAQLKKSITKQPDKRILRKYLFHRDAVFDIKMSPFSSSDTMTPLFASASADTTCCLWASNLSHLNPLLVYKGHTGAVNRLKFHPTSQMVCSVSGDQSIHLWKYAETLKQNDALSLNKSESMGRFVGESEEEDLTNRGRLPYLRNSKLPSIDNLHKSGDFGGDESNERTQVDLFTQDLLDSHIDFKDYQNEGVNTDSENDDSLNELQRYHITEEGVQGMIRNRPIYIRNPHVKNTEAHNGIVSSCDWTNKGERVVTSCWDGCVRIFDTELKEIQKIVSPNESAYLNDVSCAYQSSLIAASSSDGNVFLWDHNTDSKTPVATLKSHSDPVNCAAFTPNDRFIVTGTDTGDLRIFDYRNGSKPVKTIQIKAGGVNNIAISDYHQRMLVSMDKRVAKIYDLSGHLHATLPGHELMVTSGCWSSDGSMCFTASIDRQIIQHDMQATTQSTLPIPGGNTED